MIDYPEPNFAQQLSKTVKSLEDLHNGVIKQIHSSCSQLGQLIRCYGSSKLYVVAGHAQMGMTKLVVSETLKALDDGHAVCICTIGAINGNPYKAMQVQMPTTDSRLTIHNMSQFSVEQLIQKAKALKYQGMLDILFIDSLSLDEFEVSQAQGKEINSIAVKLKRLVYELKIPVVVVAELSETVEGSDRANWPSIDDFGNCDPLYMHADVVMLCYRSFAQLEQSPTAPTHVQVVKNRTGPEGVADLY
ncbi:hypothetical protein J2I47_19200 [Fibrella sp. HMF5335]|uniref:SF4 helicase domain-containing protein n=1 Tax=Fibrella rubiginis TaxID=2817060 RepID=A0A939GI16_9BACT|nr:DnaB-like helicase C-terminal domain-containing protein [Fibrella rubiginis]MBO0938686.1 hypothetical protein [Fibrella rubiginis]